MGAQEKKEDSPLTLEKLKIDERLRAVEQGHAGNKVLLHTISESLTQLVSKVTIQNGRVSKLENWQSYLMGGVGAVGIIFSFVVLVVKALK